MKRFFCLLTFFISLQIVAQASSTYTVSFKNAVHHEAKIEATFTNLKTDVVEFTMSRTSPGRYALHEFVKNIYNVKVTNGKGQNLNVARLDPYSWSVSGHDGTINISYILFANHGDGTYSQIDETHAHLNMPASFVYVPSLAKEAVEITFTPREDLNWKIATQLKHKEGNTYTAKDLQYFMDSPTEISNHDIRSFNVDGQTINFVLHHKGTKEEFDTYFEQVKNIVLQQKAVFGELPKFDHDNYYFLACYMPNVDGDGMEHRNSTILTDIEGLAQGGMKGNIGTVSHEFFHAWNVERIRPLSLEPFDFSKANMSGDLWFAEGFTSYYDSLILCRAGIITPQEYIEGLTNRFNYVWNSPGLRFFNPIEMSYQAPFVDAAKSIDPNNRDNTFVSYYSYGAVLGLALDLSLREQNLNLDDYMKRVWKAYGKKEIPYRVDDLHKTLIEYAGQSFADNFFNDYIYNSKMPKYKVLFDMVGVELGVNRDKVGFGAVVKKGIVTSSPIIGLSAYNAGLNKGDKILKIGSFSVSELISVEKILSNLKPGDNIKITFERFGETKETSVTLLRSKDYYIKPYEVSDKPLTDAQKQARAAWLNTK